jgi:hypothetical protein
MTFIAETCRWWLIAIQVAFRFDLYLFYLLVHLNPNGDALPKQETPNRLLLSYVVPANTHLNDSSSLLPWLLFETSKLLCQFTDESPAAEWGCLTGSRLGTSKDFRAVKCKSGAVFESPQWNVPDIEVTWDRSIWLTRELLVLGLGSPYWQGKLHVILLF